MSAFKRSRLTVKISFRVTDEENQSLQAKADAAGVDKVDIIREALDAYFREPVRSARPRRSLRDPSGHSARDKT